MTVEEKTEIKEINRRMEEIRENYKLAEKKDMATGHPEIGDWYVHQVLLKNGKSRFYLSKLPKDETFEMTRRWVLTEFGEMKKGLGVAITSRFLNVMDDYHNRDLGGVFLVVSCPAYVRSNVSVQKMTEEVKREDFEQIKDVHEFNAALRMMDLVDRERARAKNLQEDVKYWQELVNKDRGAYARAAHEAKMRGDQATYDEMTKSEGFDFGKILDWMKENPVKALLIIGLIIYTIYYIWG